MTADEMLGRRYTLRHQLGRGGMAVVWRAHDAVLGRDVAVKVLAGRHATDPVSRRRIRDEARAAAALSHPNIAQVHDYGESEYQGVVTPYVVMELIPGGTLHDRLARGPIPAADAMRIGAEVAAALAAAHADGLVHRDIKPANVMVTPAGTAKVVDFGIAAAAETDADGSELFGTPAYLAPERLLGGVVEPASDVYALGVLLYRLLSGHSPWTADSTTQMLSAHIYVEPDPLPPQPGVPAYVTALCNRCLAKDATMRPTARDLAEVLAQGAGIMVVVAGRAAESRPSADTGSAADTGPVKAHGPAAPRGRRRWPVLVAAALIVAALIGSVWVVTGRRPGSHGPAWAAPVAGASSPAVSMSGAAAAASVPAPPPAPGRGIPATRPVATAPEPAPRSKPAPAPAGAPPRTPTRAPTTVPPAGRFTFSSTGGTVVASCPAANKSQLLSVTPTSPYTTAQVKAGPSGATFAVFQDGKAKVRMSVTCRQGTATETTSGPK